MDLDDWLVNSLKIEGYDISCVWLNSQAQGIPRGTVMVHLSLFPILTLYYAIIIIVMFNVAKHFLIFL